MNKPVLLILAASVYQLDVISTAKRMGYYVITVDNILSNPGHRLADKSYNIDITDHEAILAIARYEKIHGVIAACTDVGVPTAAYIAHCCQLTGPPWPESLILTNKILFRRFLTKEGFPTPKHFKIKNNTSISKDFFKKKWIIKPDHSSGSKGIFIIDSLPDFQKRKPECLFFSPNSSAIMEQFLDGDQKTCEGIIRNGRVKNYVITDRQTVAHPFAVTCGHRVPSNVQNEAVLNDLIIQLDRIFSLLRVDNCLFDCDFVFYNEQVYILEVTPRLGGNSLSRLFKHALRFDMVEYGIQLACGNADPNICFEKPQPTAVILFGTHSAGKLRYNEEGFLWAKRKKWVKHIMFDYDIGSQVKPFINGRNRVGECIIVASSRDELDRRIQRINSYLDITAY